MTKIEEKLAEQGYTLPDAAAPIGSYLPYSKSRNLLFISGQLPFRDGEVIKGRLGDNMTTVEGAKAAAACAVGIVAQIKAALNGDFGRIRDIVKLEGFVAATPDFEEHPKVINGASDLMAELFCGRGTHCRTAVGVSSLPLGAAVEIAAIVSID
ncbi:RidA family protein [Parvularcula sp. ZS-1/3]|uniref:RidA family protein n=1 Tax=Parvularcula mediterranea TaxID=2732508 RepID=A0A7Y3W5T8_9PROT|nr:RidA family protein [Parvularcula mediterranea]NNU16687.1 RidA family protein [Parvularcula mediterranea]